MRLAYLIAAHKNPEQVTRLVEAVDDARDRFVLHLDVKSPEGFRGFLHRAFYGRDNVCFLPSRSVGWGSWSQCQVELDAIRHLLAGGEWDYFINLSGQDYPLRSRRDIVAELSRDPRLNYIGIRPLSSMPLKVRMRARFMRVDIAGHAIRLPIPLAPPRGFALRWKGSQWHVLTYDFCHWLTTSDRAAACIAYLRRVWVPDEFLMQSLIMNSPFAGTLADDFRREIVWAEGKPSPEVLTMRHLGRLTSSRAWFARKFDTAVDPEILDLIERRTAKALTAASQISEGENARPAYKLGSAGPTNASPSQQRRPRPCPTASLNLLRLDGKQDAG